MDRNISYDSAGRILHTNKAQIVPADVLPTFHHIYDKHYTYDISGNLIQTILIEDHSSAALKTNITNYSNYDSHKNPFRSIKVPFIEIRDVRYSMNNHKYTEWLEGYGDETPTVISWLDHYGAYEYNEFDYPTFAIYDCE